MRLTLRTMLCYLDDVLEPSDAEELGRKIEESEYASTIVHRIRTSMRRLRLGTPELWGDGMAKDPNTVADYLDNTLEPDKVADFEKICLSPDAESHLAEVAACHQVLTLVLGEAAEVPPSLRQRIYSIGDLESVTLATSAAARIDAAHGAPSQANADEASAAAADTAPIAPPSDTRSESMAERQKPEIPEYLRAGRKRRVLPMALAAAALLAVVALATTPWWLPPGKPVATSGAPADLFDVPSDPATAGGGAPATNIVPEPAAGPGAHVDEAAPGVIPGGAAETDTVTPGLTDDAAPPPGEAVARVDGAAPTVEGETPAGPPAELPAEGSASVPALPPADKVVAHYISTGQALARRDAAADSWIRLGSRAAIKPAMQLRSLPTYRPQILFDNGLQLTCCNESALTVGNTDADGTPEVSIAYGQLVLATVGKAGAPMHTILGERLMQFTMLSDDAALALAVRRFHLPGDNPLVHPAHVEVTATVTGGQVQWQESDAPAVTLATGQQIVALDTNVATVRDKAESPAWTRTSDVSDIDRLASATMEPLLEEERPLDLVLEELAEHPRVEIRSLAARGLGALDRYERLIDSFNDESLKSYWSDHYDALTSVLARSPQAAQQLSEAFNRRRGDEGPRLFSMIVGYNDEQL
ncbi:MAG: hypothetical protein KDA41_05125, partial [Planctomycetales bacterium]|nr:hypothetical protein [Planctomycetales bacterium]